MNSHFQSRATTCTSIGGYDEASGLYGSSRCVSRHRKHGEDHYDDHRRDPDQPFERQLKPHCGRYALFVLDKR